MRGFPAFAALAGLTIFLVSAPCLSGDEAPPAPGASPPAFRRIFIPADDIDKRQWTSRYFSVDAAEFALLLRSVYDGARGAPDAQRSRLEKADYLAQLVNEDLLVGSATLHMDSQSDKPTLWTLDPCSLALESAQWGGAPSTTATLGVNPDGRTTVLVAGSQLECRWSQRGERTASGAVTFRLELPGCPSTRVLLDAPAGQEVVADRGIVSKNAAAGARTNRWTIELGGQHRVTLRIVSENALRADRPLTLLRQSLSYEFSSRGINVGAQLRLDVHGEPLERATLALEGSLQLVAAKIGEASVPWSATTDRKTGQLHVLLEFPEPVEGTGRVLQLSAVAPPATGQRLRLPGLQPKNMAWQEGTAELLIPDTLELVQLVTDGCRQSRVTPLPAPLAGESIEIQYYEPGATIEVLVAEPRRRLSIQSGTLVEVGVDEITSRSAVNVEVAPHRRRTVRIGIREAWTVDSVEDLQTKRPVQWDVDEPPGEPAELEIALGQPGQVVVRGHRTPPAAAVFEAGQLQMLDFSEFAGTSNWISVRVAEGSELRWTGSEELNRRDAASLEPSQLQLFPEPPDALVYAEDEDFAQSNVMLQRRLPNYAADIHIDAAVRQDSLSETYTIHCLPDAARVDRLLVHFSEARDVALEWNLAGGNSGQFSARKLSAGEQKQAGLPTGGEVWELLLRLARPGAFELRAQRSVPFTGETALALVSVRDATTQRGTLAIRALGDTGLSIKNRRLMSVPAELLQPDRYQTARATYHYQPSGDDLGTEPAVSIAPAKPQQAETGAWVWSSRLESRFAVDGTCVHQATIRIQTAGRRQIRVELPAGATLHSAGLNAEPLASLPAASWTSGQLIDLPSGRRHATLSLYYATAANLPTVATAQEPPFPTVDVPVMTRKWSIWLPPGYEATAADPRAPLDEVSPPTWSQRLFGPLGRETAGQFFNPLAASDWRETFAGTTQAQQARQGCEQLIGSLGNLLADYANDEGLAWGQLLSLSSETEAPLGRVLLVDAQSLTLLGLTPQSPVRFDAAEAPLERGLGLLRQANLVAIASPGAVLITSATGAASYRDQISPASRGMLHSVTSGRLAEQLRAAASGTQWSPFETVELWRAEGTYEPPSWEAPENAAPALGNPHGWSNYHLQCSETLSPRIRIARTATIRSLAWAIFLAVVAMGLWRPFAKAWALVALVAMAAAVALFVPAAYAPLASAAMLGGIFCLAARLTHLEPAKVAKSDLSRGLQKPRSSVVQHVVTMLLLGALINAAAAEPEAAEPPSAPVSTPPIYRVYVPVDADQKPAGGKYYVPDELYEELLRKAAAVSGAPKDWIVKSGTYQGSLSRDPATARLGLSGLRARFELRVFQTNVPVQLPLSRTSWGSAILTARLDGRVIPVVWSAAGDALVLGPLEADEHRLELDLQPSVPTDAPNASLDLPIPPLAQATLEMNVGADGPAVEVQGARGQVSFDKQRGELIAQLGSANRLSVRWPTGGGMQALPPNLEAEELIWVKVRPGTTVLDARFKYRVLSGRVRQLRLLTDPRLSLLSSPNAQSAVTAVHTIPGDPQRIELELARDVSDELVIDLSFLVTGTSGVGNLRLPRLESTGARAARRWLGVSVDPALQPKIQRGEDSRALDINEFLAAWGSTDAKPHAAYSIPRGEPLWVLSTQPSAPQTSVEQSLALSLGRSAALVRFDAAISIAGGVLVQLGLEGPPGIAVDQVSMLEDNVQRVARWSVDPGGRISVFLTAPIDGRQQLSLRGRWKPASPAAFEVPRLRLLGADLKANQLQLYRQPAVLATLEKSAAAREVDPLEIEPQEGFGSLAGGYELLDETARIAVKLAPNSPRLHALAMTSVEREDDRWMAEMNYQVEVQGGLADTLHFEIPPQWSEPFRLEPNMPSQVISVPGEQRRQLILYPPKPLAGKQEVTIRGRVAPSPGDRLSVPDVVPLHAQQLERFVILPRLLELQQVTWDTLGLLPAKLPAEFEAHSTKTQSKSIYKVAGEHFQASLKAVQRTSAVAQVDLVDIHLAWQPDGSYQAVAAFDVAPGGSTDCVLELPKGCRILHASVEQLPALLVALPENRWRLGLGPQQLPQRIEVVYTGSTADSPADLRFQAPRLVDLAVGQTLWTIYGLPRFAAAEARQSSWQVSPAEQHLKRLTSVTALVELPAEVVTEHLPEEIARWYASWRNRYSAQRAALRRELIAARRQTAHGAEGIVARKLDDRMRSVDARLGASRASLQQLPVGDASIQFAALSGAGMLPAHYVGQDASNRIELRYAHSAADHFLGRCLAGLAILLVGGVLAWWLRSRTLPTFAPWLIVSGVGFAWWLALAPSVVGFLALVVAASAGVWSGWRGGLRPQQN